MKSIGVLAMVALLMAGCGSTSDDSTSTTGSTTTYQIGGCVFYRIVEGSRVYSIDGCPFTVANVSSSQPTTRFALPLNTTGLSIFSTVAATTPTAALEVVVRSMDGAPRTYTRNFTLGEPETGTSELQPGQLQRTSEAFLSFCGSGDVEVRWIETGAARASVHAIRVYAVDDMDQSLALDRASCNGFWG